MKLLRWRWIYLSGLIAGDAVLVYFAFWSAYQIRFYYEPFLVFFPALKGNPGWMRYHQALLTVIPIWIIVFSYWGGRYGSRFLDSADDFLSVLKTVGIGIVLIVTLTFLYRRYEYSRLVIALSGFVSVTVLFLYKEAAKTAYRHIYNLFSEPEQIVLVAEGKIAETVARQSQRSPHYRLTVFSGAELDELGRQAMDNSKVREAFVQTRFLPDKRVEQWLDWCEDNEVEIKILPDFLEMRMGEILVDNSMGVPVLHLKPLSLHGARFWMKRAFDTAVCIAIIAVFCFPFLAVSLLIMLDSKGSPFFVQDRVGFKEKIFKCLKFRTMRADAELLLDEMNLPSFRGGPAFKMKDDPRITRVGRWLRKFSMDELPQIWNVLKGEMSLIGPRPQVLSEASGNPEWARKRYRILPGITGLWQVSGRADLQYEDMMRLDIFYLENWTFGLDLRILLKTFPVVLSSKGAY